MSLDLKKEKGIRIDDQKFDWGDMVRLPFSKLNDDAFTRVRVIFMNGIESDALRFKHVFSRMNNDLRLDLARIRRVEQFQQTTVNWLLPPDQSALETTIGYEQVAVEVTASIAKHEPDPYLAQVYRFGLLEDFDHLYRYSALMDRVEGKDANNLLQSYTDIRPGRPTMVEHRAPEDDLRDHYDRRKAAPISKLHAATLIAAEYQTHDYYMTVGPTFADPLARQLYAEIAAIEEQHVTQYESLGDPSESWLEKWLLHEATECYNYYACYSDESNSRIKSIWERFLGYELGHLQYVAELFQKIEGRDRSEVIPDSFPEPIKFESHREFVRETLRNEVDLRASGTQFIHKDQEGPNAPSVKERSQLNAKGCPSEIVADGYQWRPGTELKSYPKVA